MKEIRLVELRANQEDEGMIVEGYAAVFDSVTDLGWVKEVISRGAFDNADMSDIVMKYNHEDSFLPMARTRGGSLQFEVDDHGLKIRAKLPETSTNKDIYMLIQEGVLSKMSFAFTVNDDEYDRDQHKRTIRGLKKLYDTSFVGFPANPGTDIGVATRDYFNGVIEAERAERLAKEEAMKEIKARYWAERKQS